MKILYLGKFTEPWSTDRYVAHALRANHVEVKCASILRYRHYRALKSLVASFKPTVVLFNKVRLPCFAPLIRELRAEGILTVCWQWDLYWGYRSDRLPQFGCDLLFTTDGGHDAQWKCAGYNHFLLRQGIHEPEHVWCEPNTVYDVGFVGSIHYPGRFKLIKWLRETYRKRFIHHTHTRGLALNKALSQIKVVVGDSYPSPRYWSNRIYEVTGRGGFLIHPLVDGLEEEFISGVHYGGFDRRSWRQLWLAIEYWLNHDKRREQVRRAGFERCGSFTYKARAAQLLERIRGYA